MITTKLLIDEIAKENSKFSKKDLQEIINLSFSIIKDSFLKDEKVFIANFGTFQVVERKARIAVNPATREKISVPAKKSIKFKLSKNLKELLNN